MVTFTVFTALAWLMMLLGWWGWSRRRHAADLGRIRARVSESHGGAQKTPRGQAALIRTEDRVTGRVVLRLLEKLQLKERLRQLIEQAGLKWSAARTIHGSLAFLLAGFAGVWYLAPQYREAAAPGGAVLGALPFLYLLRARRRRLRRFEELFPEALEFLARAMRAGHAFSVSLEMIHAEFAEPVSGEFKRAFDEQSLGMPLETALAKMGRRVPLLDVHFFVSAVLLQKRTGGNLAELLDKLAYLIRERFKLRGRIRAISAHGKMTGAVLSAIPIAVGLMMCWVNQSYARFFVEDETGKMMIGAAVVLQLIGYGVIRKIVSIEV